MDTKRRRCAFCNSAIHEGGSFVAFDPEIKVTINGCSELIRHADFQCHSFPKVFCNWDCFHRFFGAEFIDALPSNPSEWEEGYYDQKFSRYVKIDQRRGNMGLGQVMMDAADWYYAIDAQNVAGCWENLENIRHGMQGGWQGGYELYRWYISLKTCPRKKYKLLRLTLDKGDGPATVCTKELFE